MKLKKKKQIANTKVFNTKAKQYNRNDLEAEEERAKRTMRRSLGIMGELEDQYNRDKKKSYSDSKYSAFIQREQNDPRVKMNKQQGDIFLQYQKGALSREKATDKILCHALKSRRQQLFKHHDDDDDVQGAEGGKESEDDEEEFFDTSDVIFSPEDRERALIRKNIQTDKVLDLIANTAPTVAQRAQTPTVAQQADMYNLRTTAERKPTQKFTPSTYNNQQKTKKKRVGVKKEEDAKLGKQKVKWKKYKLCNTITYRPSPSTFFKMKKKTKVMLSSPSNPKHKLRKCNVKSKRRKKYKRREILLIEKLKELTLSSKK